MRTHIVIPGVAVLLFGIGAALSDWRDQQQAGDFSDTEVCLPFEEKQNEGEKVWIFGSGKESFALELRDGGLWRQISGCDADGTVIITTIEGTMDGEAAQVAMTRTRLVNGGLVEGAFNCLLVGGPTNYSGPCEGIGDGTEYTLKPTTRP